MNKIIKLISLIVLSLSVYIIYNNTYNSYYVITNIGDKLSTGTTSYGIKEKSYAEYYKDYLEQEKKKVKLDNTYSTNNQTLSNMLQLIKDNPTIKKKLIDSNIIIITLGYNDLIYGLCTEENNKNETKKILKEIDYNYKELIKEIKKYYHNEIIVIGYYEKNNINDNIIELNKILKKGKGIHYIDTYSLLKNKDTYFDNYNSYYPNSRGYYEISKKIISKTLEIS